MDLQQLDAFCSTGNSAMAASYVLDCQQVQLREQHVPRFWSKVSSEELEVPSVEFETALVTSLQELSGVAAAHQHQLAQVAQRLLAAVPLDAARPAPTVASLQHRYQQSIVDHLAAQAPVTLPSLLTAYLTGKFEDFATASPVQLCSQEHGNSEEAAASMDQVMGMTWLRPLHSIVSSLTQLGLTSELERAAITVACVHVQQQLAEHGRQDFQSSILAAAERYVQLLSLQLLQAVLPQEGKHAATAAEYLQYFIHETIAQLRISQMFDIVIEYPDSLPAIQDLRQCLQRSSLQQHFVGSFRTAIRSRLLHAGASTTDIIGQYVSTIKALREVDPSGVLLEAVADPIRDYLRSRKDTIRCIVAMLTDDSATDLPGGESLFEELNRSNEPSHDVSDTEMDDDEGALAAAEAWEPDPITADPLRGARSRRMNDIISALVGIYGSKDLFINEYRLMLADRLAAKTDFDCNRELRTMELLKLRFGEGNLHNAEIMLGDFASSKRLNALVHEKRGDLAKLKATIMSELYWPPFSGETIQLHPQLKNMLEGFAAEYHHIKTPRKLQWKPFLGSVHLSITSGGKTFDLERVPPLQAAIILHFAQKPQWALADLAAAMELTQPALRKALMYWTSQGFLREGHLQNGSPAIERVEDLQSAPTMTSSREDEELPSAVISAEEQEAMELSKFEQYVLGMLTNFDNQPLDRIQNMLKMFMPDPPTPEQLSATMSRLVAQEKVTLSGLLYRLVK